MAYAEPEHLDEKGLERLNPDLDAPDRRSRVEAAIALKVAGANYSEIAEVLSYSTVEQARSAVERGLAATASEEDRSRQREIASRRLERLLRGLWRKATDEDNPEHLSAARTALAIVDRHIRLWGSDAPSEMVIFSPAKGEMEAWIESMVKRVRQGLPEEADIIDADVVDDDAAS
jgi:DNA-binding transcriptional ArsR family regulator